MYVIIILYSYIELIFSPVNLIDLNFIESPNRILIEALCVCFSKTRRGRAAIMSISCQNHFLRLIEKV